jgi:hypothetical protein
MSDLAGGLASTANATPAAAPAPAEVSAPASQPASSPTPVSLVDHLRQAEEPASDAPPTPEAQAPAPAIAEQPQVEAVAEKPSEPPQHRWADILENARKKAAEEAVAQFQQQYRGGELQIAERFKADPVGFITQAVAELQAHPQFGPQLRSHAARTLAQRGPKAEPEPQPDLVGKDASGQEVSFFSAEQARKWQQWQSNQMRQQLMQEFAPVMDIAKEREAEKAQTQYVAQAMDAYRPAIEEVMEMPGFKEHRVEIVKRQQELFDEAIKAGQQADPMRLVLKAYREIVPGKLQQQQTAQLASSALAKAAGRDANPAAVVSSPPPAPKSMLEAFQQVGLR